MNCKIFRFKALTIGVFLILSFLQVQAQVESDERPLLHVEDGLTFEKDSLFQLHLRFRMQNRMGFTSQNGRDLNIREVEARIRRMRLRFDGYLLTPRLGYYIQLSFSKADQDLEDQEIPQTIRDGILYYTFNKNFYIGFGQSKLPGNRERVISSGNLQFAERSITNAVFNIDRDFGLFAYYSGKIGDQFTINFKNAASTGEGRNASAFNNQLAYTSRVELLPFGNFSNLGDYSMGDTEIEETPKLSLGFTYHQNNGALRVFGTRGLFLESPRDMRALLSDIIFKYKGFSTMVEYMSRQTEDPVIFADARGNQYVYVGHGWNAQTSYMWENMWEVAARYSILLPDASIQQFEQEHEVLTMGTTRYLNKHRVKVQTNLQYIVRGGRYALDHMGNRWNMVFQVEFGI